MKSYFGSKTVDFVTGLVVLGVAGLALVEAVRLRAEFWAYLCVLGVALVGLALVCSSVERK